MNKQLIPKPTHGSLEWLQIRHRDPNGRCIVGASEVSTLMNANQYETIGDLAVRKLMQPEVTPPNEAMRRGNILESALLQYASEELRLEIDTPEVMYLNDRIISTLDGRAKFPDDHVIVEAKTNNFWSHGQELPSSWFWQAQAQMFCTGTDLVQFVVLDKHMRLGMDMVERHERSVEHMIEAVESFCTAIDEERLPDDIALTVPQVNDLYPKAEGEVELDHSSLVLIDEWNAIKEAMKDLDSKEKRVKDALANLLRDSEFGSVNGQRVLSFKSQSAKRFDSKALVAAHPELETQFTTQSSFRVLRVVK